LYLKRNCHKVILVFTDSTKTIIALVRLYGFSLALEKCFTVVIALVHFSIRHRYNLAMSRAALYADRQKTNSASTDALWFPNRDGESTYRQKGTS
jgi:hypothetical protein